MKAIVTVMLKNGVLDPQGKAIGHALGTLGFTGVGMVRAGKIIELEDRPGQGKGGSRGHGSQASGEYRDRKLPGVHRWVTANEGRDRRIPRHQPGTRHGDRARDILGRETTHDLA